MSDLLKVRVGGSKYLCKWELGNKVEIGGRWYPYVKIGNQLWLAENLKLEITGAISNSSYPEFGLYYNYSQMDTIDCPQGWRLPTHSDLINLANIVGYQSNLLLVDGELGFNAPLSGTYSDRWGWNGVNQDFKLWSSTYYTSGNRYGITLMRNSPIQIGFSTDEYRPVRLVKDS